MFQEPDLVPRFLRGLSVTIWRSISAAVWGRTWRKYWHLFVVCPLRRGSLSPKCADLEGFNLRWKTGENFPPNGTVQTFNNAFPTETTAYFIKKHGNSVKSKWYSDFPIISVKMRKEEYLWRYSISSGTFAEERPVPVGFPLKKPGFFD